MADTPQFPGRIVPTRADRAAVMRSDPAIAQGLMHCERFPYGVAVWADSFRLDAWGRLDPENGLRRIAQDCSVLSLLSHDFRL